MRAVARFFALLYMRELLRCKQEGIAEEVQRHVDYPRRIAMWRAEAAELERRISNMRGSAVTGSRVLYGHGPLRKR